MDGEIEKRLKICLAPDVPDWAYGHISDHLIANLSDRFDFKRVYVEDINNVAQLLLLAEDCDIIHVFWRAFLSSYWNTDVQAYISNLGMSEAEFHHKFIDGKVISTEVYDHLLLEGAEYEMTKKLFIEENSLVTHYAVSSLKLNEIYTKKKNLVKRPCAILPDGVDLDRFYPMNMDRFDHLNERTIRFGWVGNSKWWSVEDLKGIGTIIKPAFEQLRKEGYNVELITSDRLNGITPHHKMPKFYADIDCYVCASLYEGTPNPILEAMACGLPVITTDVGLVPELFGPRQMQYVLKERSVTCFAERVRHLASHLGEVKLLSQENQERIRSWSWKKRAQGFGEFWASAYREMHDLHNVTYLARKR